MVSDTSMGSILSVLVSRTTDCYAYTSVSSAITNFDILTVLFRRFVMITPQIKDFFTIL